MTTTTFTISSPVGLLGISTSEKGITEVILLNKKIDQIKSHKKGLNKIKSDLEKYFNGSLSSFDLPVDVEGTDFQKAVWEETKKIPYGKTVTYSDIAKKIGHPKAVRAVGTALGKNPVCIIVPCHRVVPKGGGVGQYAYGPHMKKQLIDLEGGRG